MKKRDRAQLFVLITRLHYSVHFRLSSTACSLPLALVASQRIWPESLMPTASVRVKPEPAGISVLRLTSPPAVVMKGTCFPALKGL